MARAGRRAEAGAPPGAPAGGLTTGIVAHGAGARRPPLSELLPQTQCTKCGYPGCDPYAEAIAAGQADINRCVPGGDATIRALSQRTGRPVKQLDPSCGAPGPLHGAVIDERYCIGCTLCIEACPVDAIVGAPKWMHTVLDELCTGCELCLPPCPVDCIAMVPVPAERSLWTAERADAARRRYDARNERRARGVQRPNARRAAAGSATPPRTAAPAAGEAAASAGRRAFIEGAVARVRARRRARDL